MPPASPGPALTARRRQHHARGLVMLAQELGQVGTRQLPAGHGQGSAPPDPGTWVTQKGAEEQPRRRGFSLLGPSPSLPPPSGPRGQPCLAQLPRDLRTAQRPVRRVSWPCGSQGSRVLPGTGHPHSRRPAVRAAWKRPAIKPRVPAASTGEAEATLHRKCSQGVNEDSPQHGRQPTEPTGADALSRPRGVTTLAAAQPPT